MMRSKFWQGLVWGSLVGSIIGVIISPMTKSQQKPLIERSADVIRHATHDFMREARIARKRLIKK